MGILRHKKDKTAKAKRAKRKAAPGPGKAKDTPAAAPGKPKRRRATRAPAPTPVADREKAAPDGAPPLLSTGTAAAAPKSALAKEPTGPVLPGMGAPLTGERRRWPDRHGPAAGHGEGKKAGSDSGESGDSPPRTGKLVPTNAVHATERRIKRRMHKNSALLAAAAAALIGVLILSNQSEPPELVLHDRQVASRLPSDSDGQSDILSSPVPETNRNVRVPDSDGSRFIAPASPDRRPSVGQIPQLAARPQPAVGAPGLNAGDIVEMERMLSRLELAVDPPDGILDGNTEEAIRLYQEIAGLPVDGKASPELLADMREVVRILDGIN